MSIIIFPKGWKGTKNYRGKVGFFKIRKKGGNLKLI